DGRHDGSPHSFADLPQEERIAAFTPTPEILPTSDILFDSWALTTIREKLPGRPPVEPYLHGIAEWEPPETHVAWREEVGIVGDGLLDRYKPEDLLEAYPIKPHELLRDVTSRVFKHLQELAKTRPRTRVWVIDPDNSVRVATLEEIASKGNEERLAGRTVLLPPAAGGLQSGTLDGKALFADDVADEWYTDKERTRKRRVRTWDDSPVPEDMRLVLTIDRQPEADEDEEPTAGEEALMGKRLWKWYTEPRSADDDGSETAREQELAPHLEAVAKLAQRIAERLALPETEAGAAVLAARWHDLGKARQRWQYYVCNDDYPTRILAKSLGTRHWRSLDGYRHEFASLLDVQFGRDDSAREKEWADAPKKVRDLALHSIAAHHGCARPHFSAANAFDPESPVARWEAASQETPVRFARLQRMYGRWGLAYLESLLRAADWADSAAKPKDRKEKEKRS
ncbi:MAG: type I-U CRISPR-associated helicase/endonuclease Cas3, partial [Pirellulaceae bacterium]|nr:type I-U CRISPR-associated helicase/endonuclease Cas3 [Pirellulaceae bacterium]